MTVFCNVCGHQVHSLQEGKNGQTFVMDWLMRHLAEHHKKESAELAKAIAAVSGYLTVRLYGRIPATETELIESLAEAERELFAVISGDAITRLREVLMENQKGGRGGAN